MTSDRGLLKVKKNLKVERYKFFEKGHPPHNLSLWRYVAAPAAGAEADAAVLPAAVSL